MSEWNYLQDVKKEQLDDFCKDYQEKNPNHVCKFASPRSNNPGMVAVYYKNKE